MINRLFRAVLAPICLLGLSAAAPAPLTPDQWREDLRVLRSELETRHPNPYHLTTKTKLDAAIAALDGQIPRLSRNQIIAGMMRIAALVGDGHTRIDPRKDKAFGFPSLPLKLYDFDDGMFVRAAAPAYSGFIGWRVDAIGGVPVAEAVRRVKELISADNEMGKRQLAPLYLGMPDILQALGLATRRDAATLTISRAGRSQDVTVEALNVDAPWPPDTDISLVTPSGWADACKAALPLYLRNPLDYHRLVSLPANQALYIQLNWVSDLDQESLDQFGARILNRAQVANPRALILDLRFNQGGNGSLRNGLVADLIRAEDDDTRLFVITGRGTFSASQFILSDIRRLTHAVLVGEPASSKPSSFGDAFKTLLPNSGLVVRTSIYWWQDGQNSDPYTWIDLAAPLRFSQYAACRDPALEAALVYKPSKALEAALEEGANTAGLTGARRVVGAYLRSPENRYANTSVLLPRAAEAIFARGHKTAALTAATAVAKALPGTIDAWVVLAYVAAQNGSQEVASRAAERALKLDPNNRTAREIADKAAH